jgi:aldehyde dehydrogenase (NAD+)
MSMIPRHLDLLVGGEWIPALGGARLDVRSPWDDALIGSVPRGRADDVDRAVTAARRAAKAWQSLPPRARERLLLDVADRVERAGQLRLLELLIEEGGSTIIEARAEIAYAADLLRAAAGEARRLYGDTLPNDRPERLSFVLREPLGVVGVISPFNSPVALLTKMLAFPLAAGNALVIKPSESTSLTALELLRFFVEAEALPGLVNVVTGLGDESGRPLVEHPGVDGLAFTGSTSVGRRLGAAAALRMARVQLELGGKNPVVVLADADPDRAAAIIAQGAYAHAGQICMAGSRIIVERTLAERLTSALVRTSESLYLGERRDARSVYGPLVNDAAVDKVLSHLAQARARGAEVLTGGRVREGRVFSPTVVRRVPLDCDLWREETFGPVICVAAAGDVEEAVAMANDNAYGLSAAVLTNDLRRGLEAARGLRSGAVHLGMHPFQSNTLAPIGGVGASGVGRSGGKYSVEHFTELKWISVELAGPPLAARPPEQDAESRGELATK